MSLAGRPSVRDRDPEQERRVKEVRRRRQEQAIHAAVGDAALGQLHPCSCPEPQPVLHRVREGSNAPAASTLVAVLCGTCGNMGALARYESPTALEAHLVALPAAKGEAVVGETYV